jgi:sugar lactone lactonase YvrE
MNTPSKFLTALAVTVLLTACPGSSGDSSSTTTATTSTNIFGLAYDTTNSKLYIANAGRSTIQSFDPATNTLATLAGGDNVTGTTNDNGIAARFYSPLGLVMIDANATLIVTDTFNNALRKITALTGVKTVASYATAGGFNQPTELAASLTDLYVADSNNHAIKKISLANESVVTWAGLPGTAGVVTTNVDKLAARFSLPMGIAVDAAVPPNIYVSDSSNHTIRKIDAAGNVTTIAGTGVAGYKNSAGATAQFNLPTTMVLSGTSLYVTDTNNHAIRVINLNDNSVDTFAGFGKNVLNTSLTATSGNIDGTGAVARFSYPRGIALDTVNNVFYVGDQSQTKLRQITAGAVVSSFTKAF